MSYIDLAEAENVIAAMAALGFASQALVDSSKAFWGGVSNCGFGYISAVINKLLPSGKGDSSKEILNQADILNVLRANWLNGTALADQRRIAKSFVKLSLNESSASNLAKATGVDEGTLASVAQKVSKGEQFEQTESDLYGRFDLMLDALLDGAYQRADQSYRNSARSWSVLVSVVLAIVGVYFNYQEDQNLLDVLPGAIILGLAATYIAPVAKDLSTAISAGAKLVKTLRK